MILLDIYTIIFVLAQALSKHISLHFPISTTAWVYTPAPLSSKHENWCVLCCQRPNLPSAKMRQDGQLWIADLPTQKKTHLNSPPVLCESCLQEPWKAKLAQHNNKLPSHEERETSVCHNTANKNPVVKSQFSCGCGNTDP